MKPRDLSRMFLHLKILNRMLETPDIVIVYWCETFLHRLQMFSFQITSSKVLWNQLAWVGLRVLEEKKKLDRCIPSFSHIPLVWTEHPRTASSRVEWASMNYLTLIFCHSSCVRFQRLQDFVFRKETKMGRVNNKFHCLFIWKRTFCFNKLLVLYTVYTLPRRKRKCSMWFLFGVWVS